MVMFFWNGIEYQFLHLLTTSFIYHAVEILLEILILAGYVTSIDPKQHRQTSYSTLSKLNEC